MVKIPSATKTAALRASAVTGALAMVFLSGLTTPFPAANAQSTVVVTIPIGAAEASNGPGYSPDTVTVFIGVNNTVTWTNNDTEDGGISHTVTPVYEPSGGNWSNGSGNLPVGSSYTFTFTVPGTYGYDCFYHPWMTGTVVVKAASTTPAPEFPAASPALVLFAVIAAVTVAAPRLASRLRSSASVRTLRPSTTLIKDRHVLPPV